MRLNLVNDIDQRQFNLMFDLLIRDIVGIANPKYLSTHQSNKDDGGQRDDNTNGVSRHLKSKLDQLKSDLLTLNAVLTN